MKKALVFLLLVLLVTGAFADQPFAKAYDKDGGVALYASIGYWWGLTLSVGLEFTIFHLNLTPDGNPLTFGIMVRGLFDDYFGYYAEWGAGVLFAAHLGLAGVPLEFFAAVGLGFYGFIGSVTGWYYAYNPFNIGFATWDGVIWHFSDKFGIMLEFGYVGYTTIWGFGIKLAF